LQKKPPFNEDEIECTFTPNIAISRRHHSNHIPITNRINQVYKIIALYPYVLKKSVEGSMDQLGDKEKGVGGQREEMDLHIYSTGGILILVISLSSIKDQWS
jgi:hypothetical protein